MKENYIDECKQVQQNSTYTAETHHVIANWNRALALLFQAVPAVVAAVTGTLVATGVKPDSWLWATVVSAAISAIATVLDLNKHSQNHLSAAKNYTTLRHDARFLHEARSQRLSDEAFAVAVESLHDKYNDLVKTSPATSKLAFEIARLFVRARRHEPDRDREGRII